MRGDWYSVSLPWHKREVIHYRLDQLSLSCTSPQCRSGLSILDVCERLAVPKRQHGHFSCPSLLVTQGFSPLTWVLNWSTLESLYLCLPPNTRPQIDSLFIFDHPALLSFRSNFLLIGSGLHVGSNSITCCATVNKKYEEQSDSPSKLGLHLIDYLSGSSVNWRMAWDIGLSLF